MQNAELLPRKFFAAGAVLFLHSYFLGRVAGDRTVLQAQPQSHHALTVQEILDEHIAKKLV
jgi:hypothetical protein